MQRLTPTATDLRQPPMLRDDRIEAIKTLLAKHEVFPRRFSGAGSQGITVTYAHVDPADGPRVARLVAEGIDWAGTDVTDVTGMVAVTTTW